MSEFEYSNLSSDEDSDDEILGRRKNKTIKISEVNVSKELNLFYSKLFIDSFRLIDLFIKSKIYTYNSFLKYFRSMNFHQIYAMPTKEVKQLYISSHHCTTTTQDAMAVASKFLRSNSEEARIGAVYLLYTLYKTQPLVSYLINVKLNPKDYENTKQLVDACLQKGLFHPAYCFYDLEIRRKIKISETAVSPCLEANYPRAEVRKHMGRVADNYFKDEYEERKEFDMLDKLQLMDHQMRNELVYINKLSNLTLGRDAVPEHKEELSKVLLSINVCKKVDAMSQDQDEKNIKTYRQKKKKFTAFPGKNENVLEDMVIITEIPDSDKSVNNTPCNSRKKLKLPNKRRRITNNKNSVEKMSYKKELENELPLPKLSTAIDSDSSMSSIDSQGDGNNEEEYGSMLWRLLEGEDNNELTDELLPTNEE